MSRSLTISFASRALRCSAATLRRAAAAGPVAAVEVEYSPWSLQIETNGILDACKELNIPIVAYRCADPSPL